jgi:hypothetical protein
LVAGTDAPVTISAEGGERVEGPVALGLKRANNAEQGKVRQKAKAGVFHNILTKRLEFKLTLCPRSNSVNGFFGEAKTRKKLPIHVFSGLCAPGKMAWTDCGLSLATNLLTGFNGGD